MAARGFLGAGDIYINRIVNGVTQGMQGPYYANKFEIKPNVDKKEAISKGRNDYGQVLESVSIQQPAELTLELTEVNKESMTIALLGTQAVLSQAGGTLTAAPVVVKLNTWMPVGHEALSDDITVKNDGGTVTYVKGVDYLLNEQMGWIKALSTGSIAEDEEVELSGTYNAISGAKISGATNTDIRAEIVFDGKNQADGLPCIVRVWEAIIAADAAFDFLADDFNTVSMPGTMKTPAGKSEPFTVELRTA